MHTSLSLVFVRSFKISFVYISIQFLIGLDTRDIRANTVPVAPRCLYSDCVSSELVRYRQVVQKKLWCKGGPPLVTMVVSIERDAFNIYILGKFLVDKFELIFVS